MKKLLLLLLSVISLSVNAQVYQTSTLYGIQYKRVKVDSAFHPPYIPTLNVLDNISLPSLAIYQGDSSLYISTNNTTYNTRIFDVRDTLDLLVTKSEGSGYVPKTRTITINGVTQNLGGNITYSVGTITSVAATATNGLSVTGSPVTISGTLAFSIDTSTANSGLSRKDYVSSSIAIARLADIKYVDTVNIIATRHYTSLLDSSIHIETGTSQIVQMPDSFDYDLPFDVLLTDNTYSINTSFSMQARAGIVVVKTYYVDVNTGNDANTGLSWAQAYKSLNVALAKTDVDRIYVAKGLYPYANAWRNVSPTRSVEIIGDLTQGTGSAVYITKSINEKLTSGWTHVTNYYTATYNNVGDTLGGVLDLSILDSFGDPVTLTQQNSIANVNINPGSYYVNGVTVYIHTSDSRSPDANIELFGTNASISSLNGVVTKDVTVYIKDINFRCGSMYTTAPDGLGGMNIYIENSHNTYWGAFFNGTQEVMMFNVSGGNTNGDIINYDPELGIIPKVVEYNVDFHNNLASVGTNNQASTAHQGVRIIRINGSYSANAGQNVADVDGCRSILLGCSANNAAPTSSSSFLFGTGATQSYAWLDRCTSSQTSGKFAIDAAGHATVFSRNLTANTDNNIGSNSSISAYTPIETFGKKVSQMMHTSVLNSGDYIAVAKQTGGVYVPAAISASDLFANSGGILVSGTIVGAQQQAQVFLKGISVGGATGATVATKSLSATTPALATYAIAGQSGDRITGTNASGVLDYRQKADGSIYIGTDAASGTGNFSAFFGGNPTFNFGGLDAAQQVFVSIWSGSTLPWSFGYQGNSLSGRLQLYRNSTERFGFNSNGVLSAQTGYRINNAAPTSGLYLKSDGTNFVTSTKSAVEMNNAVPANNADVTGAIGNIVYDDSYIYIKTSAGWKRVSVSTF